MKYSMKILLGLVSLAVVGAVGAGLFFFYPHSLPEVAASAKQPSGQELIARGEYLTIAGDCAACHSTKGGKPFAGGLPFKLPFGTIYSSNITPDKEHGIGAWNDAEFVRAVRSGVDKHGENLYPAFPYASYALLSTDDILAIRAYLNTVTAVSDSAPENTLEFPFNQRWLMRGWNLLFLPSHPFENNPSKDERWNRGAYLVEGLAHCGECHTPRGLMFQRKQGQALSGGEVDGWKAWNITSDPETGVGNWSDEDLKAFLATGHAKGHGPAGGAMREAVDLSFSKLPSSDIEAIVSYLRTVPAVKTGLETKVVPSGPDASAVPSGELGARIFAGACASCHGKDGGGLANDRASIQGSHAVNDPEGSNLVRVILKGSSNEARLPGQMMPAFHAIYSDEEVAALANYVIERLSGKSGKVTAKDVAAARE
ncbi:MULTISPECIES: c-type cytochrome [Agrobacterium]|jgi:mono/diheme cytochrome c family protein|uniref:Mono/diheme cytochrome c family protein n=1 Tax=Agrobacterium tumefaciens TaxID=358 RepID=A0AAW8M1U4_AGRTU|nr:MULTISPECIES: cytochrome c [Agrobacterium]OAI82961.1 alcohol dehydrogenase [Rhizobium sp. GHKF11]MBP2511487.1 mono/diheme cytochrome c family protein [Agrobacterium tumefaciens]MBP2519312.1 mono/diheme cytochrome c family protein [Agrobacterium tumefaciens]MBP2537379.1 mono/diheme cytochrome c family protein [Agrobacterium tumefaciens]MBP2542575.1 mono/diheme cytochrome c family protein [Agrobacterium tumefaciens]